MSSRHKKLLTLLRSSRAGKSDQDGDLRFDQEKTQRAAAGGDPASAVMVERVRLAMRGAMQACLGAAGNEAAGTLVVDGEPALASGKTSVHDWMNGKINEQVDALQRQLKSARDLDTLWYLRPRLMNVIAVRQGEVAARDCLVALTALFKNHPPQGRSSRFSAF